MMLPVLSVAQINTLRISKEVTPPGGIAQVKVTLTSPQPISTGRFGFSADLGLAGVATSSSTGDVSGVAIRNAGGGISVRFTSPTASLGTSDDYPILALAFRIPQEAPPGTVFPVNLDAVSLTDRVGTPIALELQPGSVTVGGNLSITNVIPGGGVILPGQPIRVLGLGFSPTTRVRIKEQLRVPTSFVSSNEIDLALPNQFVLDGARVDATDPDGSSVSYISYPRSTPIVEKTAHEVLNRTDPIFSSHLLTTGSVPPMTAVLSRTVFSALAMQNGSTAPVTVTLEQYLGTSLQKRSTLTLPAGSRIVRDLSEWTGIRAVIGTSWRVTSSAPIQMLGLLGDDATGSLTPFAVLPM